jgi:hypothetical protein
MDRLNFAAGSSPLSIMQYHPLPSARRMLATANGLRVCCAMTFYMAASFA